jgi:uncharacterized protein
MRRAYLLLAPTLGCLVPAVAKATMPSASRTDSIAIEFGRRVPMRDGVRLAADVYRPQRAGRYPVILLRTPYLKSDRGLQAGRYFATHGYVFIAMDVRGRGDSEGDFVAYRHDGKDGYDAIEWAAAQPWSNGRVGTIGKSYDAGIEWLAALEHPPHLVTMVSLSPVGDPGTDIFITGPTGVPTPTMVSWYYFVSGHVLHDLKAVDWAAVARHLPLATMPEAAGFESSYWKQLIAHPGGDSWWDAQRYQTRLSELDIPVLHVTGWYDDVQGITIRNFRFMTSHSAGTALGQKLVVGPWPHALDTTRKLGTIDFGPSSLIDLEAYELRWFDHWLKGVDTGIAREPAVHFFRMGDNVWSDGTGWPLPGTRFTRWYLHSGGKAASLPGDGVLSTAAPLGEPPDHFAYDPANPTPFITDPNFAQLGGPDDYRSVERRADVLTFTSAVLNTELLICGPVQARLEAATSARDTDFMVKLLDVWPDGFAQRLVDGAVRARFRQGLATAQSIEPGRVYAYDVDLWNTCQAFLPGHRIRVEVASSAFPKYDRNLNTGGAIDTGVRMAIAMQTVLHDAGHPSWIELPIMSADTPR